MADVIKVPVSFGEVLDKITILEIKSERIADAEKVRKLLRISAQSLLNWLVPYTSPMTNALRSRRT